MKLFDAMKTRTVIFVGMMLQCLALAMFTVSSEYNYQLFARFLSGFSQVILTIYLPVWVDAFAPISKKTKWMTVIITAAPGGLFIGYTMTALIVSMGLSWQWSFYIHIIMLIPVSQLFFAIKEQFLDVTQHANSQNEANRIRREREIIDPDMPQPMPEMQATSKEIDEYEKWNKECMEREQERTKNFTTEQKIMYVLS